MACQPEKQREKDRARFPGSRKLIVVNNSHQTQKGIITGDDGQKYPRRTLEA